MLKYPEARGGFVKYHPPPELAKTAINDKKYGAGAVRQRAWTAFHPPPINGQFTYLT